MVQSGKADAMMVDLPPGHRCGRPHRRDGRAARHAVRRAAPYGYVKAPRTRPTSRTPSSTPLKALEKDGTWGAILTKWGVDGAITDFGVNSAS